MFVRLLPVVLAAASLAACDDSMWQSDYRQPVPPGAVVYQPGDPPTSPLTLDGATVGSVTFAAVDRGLYAYQFSPSGQVPAKPAFVQVSCAQGMVLAAPIPAAAADQGQVAGCRDSAAVAKPLYKPD